MSSTRTSIETYTGLFFDYVNPKLEQVDIDDIAHALAHTVRFGGHVNHYYSVAEHCLIVRQLVIEQGRPDLGLAALLHDAHEAYLGDLPSPLKALIGPNYRNLVALADYVIASACGFDPADFHAPAVVEADALALRHEAACLKQSEGTGPHWGQSFPSHRNHLIIGYDPRPAAKEFIAAYCAEKTK